MEQSTFVLEEWDEARMRWPEFVACMELIAPEQAPFVLGDYARHLSCYLLVALQENQVAGFLRFGVQLIGSEDQWPSLILNEAVLTEAKIHAFAVSPERRRQGIGTALQKQAIARARQLGCYQLVSHSGFESQANHRVKLALGFSAQPVTHGNSRSIFFLMPLQIPSV